MTRLLLFVFGFGLICSLLVRGTGAVISHAGVSGAAATPSSEAHSIMVSSANRDTPSSSSGVSGETTITRDGSGHFSLYVTANGQQLPFLVDTGADKVALTVESARAIGLYVDPTGFEPVAMGAGGPVRGQHVTIDRLEIGNRSLSGVDAMVLEGLGTNLLGQSALAQLGGVEMRGDRMVLR